MKIGDCIHDGFYAGKINSHHIICSPIEYDLPVEVNWFQAKEYCKSISMELPTRIELNLLYELYKIAPEYFPKRKYPWYWSSAESSSPFAWYQDFGYGYQDFGDGYQDFNYGYQGTTYKTLSFNVRAVRRVEIPA